MRKETNPNQGLGEIVVERLIKTREDFEEAVKEIKAGPAWRRLKRTGAQMVPLLNSKGV